MTKAETKFKKLVREKLGVKRVTKQAQQKVWTTLTQKNKNMYGNWKPSGSLPTPKGPITVTLKKTNKCVLGQGAYGKVCMRENVGGKKYAVKTSHNSPRNVIRERDTHIKFYYGLPSSLRKYFPQPVLIKDEPDSYGMTMFDGITLYKAMELPRSPEYKRKVIKQLRKAVFAMWTSGYIHGDIHTENIMVSKSNDNPQIQILDFGMMRKSVLNVPNRKFKLGDVNYKNLNDYWENWFKKSWNKQLNNLRLNSGNPNMIVFPNSKSMNYLSYYADKHSGGIFNNLNAYGNGTSPSPATAKAARAVDTAKAKEHLEKYKALVRNRMKMKRVTKQAQIALWNRLSNTTKAKFGTWKPQGVVKHRTTPPVPKAKTPTAKLSTDRFLTRALMNAGGRIITNENLLRFWMTHYTTAQKKEIYKKVSDPEKAKRDYPLCK